MALGFPGVDTQRLRVAVAPISLNGAYSVSMWVYFNTSPPDSTVLFILNGQYGGAYDHFAGTGGYGWRCFNEGGVASSAGSPTTATWYHVALVRESGSSQKLYVDGTLATTNSTNVGTGRAATEDMLIGQAGGYSSQTLDGRVAYVKMWNAALTADEVAQEREAIAPRRTSNLVGWWPTLPGAAERVKDYSGSSKDWTETGTFTDAAEPPVGWGAGVLVLPVASASADQTVTPSGIASAASVGTPTITTGAVTVSPTGIATAASLGVPTLTTGPVTVSPSGIASVAALGTPTVTPGAVTVTPTGIDSGAVLGTPTVSVGGATVSPDGIASTAAVGVPTITTGPVTVSASGIVSTATLGTPTATSVYEALAAAIESAATLGTPTITTGPVTLSPVGIASTALLGRPLVSIGNLRGGLSLGNTGGGGASVTNAARGGASASNASGGGLAVTDA